MGAPSTSFRVWVIDGMASDACVERLGDARRLADEMETGVGAILVGADDLCPDRLVAHGADLVVCALPPSESTAKNAPSIAVQVQTAGDVLAEFDPRVVLAGGDPRAREWAALLAAEQEWQLVSPALLVTYRAGRLAATQLDASGRRSRQVAVVPDVPLVATLRGGVAEGSPADATRKGETRTIAWRLAPDPIVHSQLLPADPALVDIRHADRLVAGGKGVGGPEGFDALRRFATALGAGVAASRMAVDLGWVEYERQVGQTGKNVAPELYVACGISGASHHLQGMLQSKHIVAINTDREAPIFRVAHLGLAADLLEVLEHARRRLRRE